MGAEKVVPREPTEAMLHHGLAAAAAHPGFAGAVWRSMYDAAPANVWPSDAAPAQPATAVGEAVLGDGDFYDSTRLPELHPDPATNAEILLDALCARLNIARQALADAAAMQVVQPTLQKVKVNAAWAMGETKPSRVLPRSATYAEHPTPPTLHTAPDAGEGEPDPIKRGIAEMIRLRGTRSPSIEQMHEWLSAYDALAAERSGAHSALVVEEAVNAKLRDKLAAAEAARDAAVGVLRDDRAALVHEMENADTVEAEQALSRQIARIDAVLTEASREG